MSSALRQNSAGADTRKEWIYPSILLFLASAASSALSYQTVFPGKGNIIAAAFCVAAFITLLFTCIRRRKLPLGRSLLLALLYCAVCGSAAYLVHRRVQNITAHTEPRAGAQAWTARIDEVTPYRYTDRIMMTAEPADGGRPLRAVSWVSKEFSFNEKDTIAFTGTPARLEAKTSLSLMREGIFYSVRLNSGNVSFMHREPKNMRRLIRDGIIERNRSLYGERAGGVINALMLGDSWFVGKDIIYDFTRAGVLHILAASGMHVAVIAAIPLFLFSLLRLPKTASYAVTSVILAGYFYITCMPVSLLRACVMFWFCAAAVLFRKKGTALNAMYLSGSAILFLFPFDLYSAGFQLSYGATFGIILFYSRFLNALPRLPLKISESCAMTFSAQLFVLPVLLLTFGELNFTGILSNIILVPGTTAGFFAAIGNGVLSCIMPSAAESAGRIIEWFFNLNLRVALYFAGLPGHFSGIAGLHWLILPYLLLWIPALIKKIPAAGSRILLTAAVLLSFIPLYTGSPAQKPEITVISPKEKRGICFSDGRALIYGGIRSSGEKEFIKSSIKKKGYIKTSIYLDDFSPASLKETSSFLRNTSVETVIIADTIPLDRRCEPFFESLDRDGIRPVFAPPVPLKNDCQYPAQVYEMKCTCDSFFSGGAEAAARIRNQGYAVRNL